MNISSTLTHLTPYQLKCHYQRQVMTTYASRHGVRAAARHCEVSRNTVRKWLRAREQNRDAPLIDARRASIRHPQKMKLRWLFCIKAAAKERVLFNQRIIAAHIKRDKNIPYSAKTVTKVLRALEFHVGYRKKKKPKKRDCRAWKRELNFLQRLQIDIKYLTDVPELKRSISRFNLPKGRGRYRSLAILALLVLSK